MQWTDKGILIAISKFGETDQLATFITENHGLSKGLIKGGLSRKQKPYLQIGNEFQIVWKSRLEEQLGFFSFDPIKIYGATLFETEKKLTILSCCCNLLYDCMAENHPNKKLYDITLFMIHNIEKEENENVLLYNYMLWEKELLAQIGFALSLDKCNATGSTKNLIFISPKTGYAICEEAGLPYKSKLLPMPEIWQKKPTISELSFEKIAEALKILAYFFDKRIYQEKNKTMPYLRRNLLK
ncbi:MAG: DNA repair protein RecO [bacterium]|nr:DNA repair protein RecO [bacterium]